MPEECQWFVDNLLAKIGPFRSQNSLGSTSRKRQLEAVELRIGGNLVIIDREVAGCDKANAMDAALCHGIMKRLEQLRTSDAQAVVLTGQGNIFSTAV